MAHEDGEMSQSALDVLARAKFEEKMDKIAARPGTAHPKMQLLMAGGPEFSEKWYEILFLMYLTGIKDSSSGELFA